MHRRRRPVEEHGGTRLWSTQSQSHSASSERRQDLHRGRHSRREIAGGVVFFCPRQAQNDGSKLGTPTARKHDCLAQSSNVLLVPFGWRRLSCSRKTINIIATARETLISQNLMFVTRCRLCQPRSKSWTCSSDSTLAECLFVLPFGVTPINQNNEQRRRGCAQQKAAAPWWGTWFVTWQVQQRS